MVADVRESVVTIAVMDLSASASRAVGGWMNWEAELATEFKSKDVIVETMGGNAAAHTHESVGQVAAEDVR